MSTLANNSQANPGNSFYALASESGALWYTFPSETGEVLLNDASGTQVLKSIGADLFFNDELLAKAGDIQDINDWALYPAVADVNMDGFSLLDVSSATINNTLTTNILDSTSISNASNIVTATLQMAGEAVPSLGQITTKTLAASGNIQGGSLTTTGGVDMSNTAITRASTVNISNSGFAPYGALTSPDGALLTWNGATINTGSAGSAAGWANFPAIATVNANSNNITNVNQLTASGDITTTSTLTGNNVIVPGNGTVAANIHSQLYDPVANNPLQITAANPSGLQMNSPNGGMALVAAAGNIEATASGTMTNTATGIVNAVSNNYQITANGGLNPLVTPNINLTAQNGNGGQINIAANPGSIAALGGVVNITGNGGTITIPQPPPELPISVTVGGEVNITANTGSGAGLYTATSAINLNAAAINSYAGAIPSFGSLLGYNTVFGNLGVSVCAGLPPSGVQFPGTIYCYGLGVPGVAGGIRMESPQGIQMLSDLYATDVYPLGVGGLNLKGRASFPGPAADVTIEDCASIAMRSAGTITGVTSINGVAYPPPAGLVEDWSTYVAVSAVDLSGQGIVRVGDLSGVVLINGSAYPPVVSSADWAAFPAIQNVDISGFELNNVNNISMPANGTIISAGQLSIFSDASGDLSLAANGGGNVNIGTGDAGDIFISTSGAGNNTTIGGDVVYLNGTLGVQVSAPVLDMTANNIYNVATLRGSLGTDLRVVADGAGNLGLEGTIINLTAPTKVLVDSPTLDANGADIANVANITNEGINVLTVQSTVNLIVSAETNLSLVSDAADVTIQGQTGASVYAATGNVSLTADSGEVIVQDSVLNMNTHKITNLSPGTAGTDAVNFTQLTFRDNTEFYVSGQGSDTNNGSILAPFLTIQAAITAAELISSASSICSINVASGNYPQSLTFNKGYVVLNGTLQSQTGNEVCEITGSITINCTGANDVFNRQVAFQGFNITCGAGQSITNTSTSSHTVSFQDCKIFVNSVCYNSTASSADARTYFTNVEIYSTNAANVSPVITTNVGLVELERLDLTVDGNAIGLLIGGTSVLNRCSLSSMEITNTAATLLPLLSFTSTTTSTHTLGNVAFAYTSAVAKTATSAIYINSGIATAIIALNNVFTLTGTASSTNFVVGYNGVGSPTIVGINNTSLTVPVLLPQTTSVQSGITQIQYTDINPPTIGAYSKSNDQTIAAVNTPVAIVFNTTQFQQGTVLVSTRVYVAAYGNYQVNYQVQTTGSISATVTTYLAKNGTAVINTGSQYTSGAGSQAQTSPQFILSLNAGDYIELFINSNTLGTSVNSTAGAGAVPAIPGAIITVTQIR